MPKGILKVNFNCLFHQEVY